MDENRAVFCVWPNEETGGLFRCPAYLVNDGLDIAHFDDHIEVHMVKETDNPLEFEIIYASNPMFYVGSDLPTVFEDLSKMTLPELAAKYTHSDFAHLTIPPETR